MKLFLGQIHASYVWINKSTVQAKEPSFPHSPNPFLNFYLGLKSWTYSLYCPGTQMACLRKQWGRRSIIHQHAQPPLRSVLHKIYRDNLRASFKWCSTMGWGVCEGDTDAAFSHWLRNWLLPPKKYILLALCSGPLGKVFFTHESTHDPSEEDFKRVCLHL